MTKLKPLTLFIFILCTIQPNNAYNLIEETCKRTSNNAQCLQYLKSDPKSPAASLNGLAVIMFNNIMKNKALNTITKIEKLLAGKDFPPGTRAYDSLKICANLYKEIATSNVERGAKGSVLGEDPEVAINAANDVVMKANQCENNFHGRKIDNQPTPVTDNNNEIILVATIAGDIVKLFRQTG
ncbi:hypothetical protein RYX36_027291 [Vicia faba]